MGPPLFLRHNRWRVAVILLLLEVSPISTQDLWSSARITTGFLGASLTKALLPLLLSLARCPALERLLVVPNFFHLRIMEATVLLGIFNAVDILLSPSPDLCLDTILPLSSVGSSFNLMAWSLLICIVSCETLYRQLCAFSDHVQPSEFITGGVLSRCVYV